jgi:CheY-like chemotaxis protein
MKGKVILLVEDNPDDEALTLRALKYNNIVNKVIVVRDGAEALDFLFGTEAHKDRDIRDLPQVVFLDLKLPKIDGLEVLKGIRADPPDQVAAGGHPHLIEGGAGSDRWIQLGRQQLHPQAAGLYTVC